MICDLKDSKIGTLSFYKAINMFSYYKHGVTNIIQFMNRDPLSAIKWI